MDIKKITLASMFAEMQSFLPGRISKETVDKAKKSKITAANNPELKTLIEDWASGTYDEDPVTLLNELETILEGSEVSHEI